MAFQQTSASDWRDLIAVITVFAVNQGWTKVYDEIENNGQVGLSKGNCKVAIGEYLNSDATPRNPISRTDKLNGGTVDDALVFFMVVPEFETGLFSYKGHPGSRLTSTTTTTTVYSVNDLVGPFSNVWLYSNSTGDYVHVVVQSTAERYTHASFGNVDTKGMTAEAPGYSAGLYHEWWPDDDNINDIGYGANNWEYDGPHDFGFVGRGTNGQLYIPDGVLDPAVGFPSGELVGLVHKTVYGANEESDHLVNNTSDCAIINYFAAIHNQLTTGGVPLTSLPAMYGNSTNPGSNPVTFLGEFPDVRLVDISNLNPAQEIKFGSEVWQVFPIKRKTPTSEANRGDNVQPGVSTTYWGLAYKKVV